MKKALFFLLTIVLFPLTVLGNGLIIDNLVVDQPQARVSFDIRWSNSWRVTTTPKNWDAVWVIVKFRECGTSPNTQWTHGLMELSHTNTGYTWPSTLEPVLSNGTAVGIDAAPNNTGVMLRRTATGVFPAEPSVNVRLQLTNLPTTGQYDVKVMGLEMVFIPEGEFTIGDNGLTSTRSENRLNQTLVGNTSPLNLPMGGSITGGPHPPSNTYVLPDNVFPRGFNAFHCMKYEITQAQYAEFLNTITTVAQVANFVGFCNAAATRNRTCDTGVSPYIYVTDRPNRAQGFLQWRRTAAFLDWAALRPMSEMEYVKVCRGAGGVVANEYAWGTTGITELLTLSTTVPSEDGSEVVLNTGANCHFLGSTASITGGDGSEGPVRVGIFATSTTTSRVETGATYYGVMEMSGNVTELVVPLSVNNITTRPFRATPGNGMLDAAGDHDVNDWPLPIPPGVDGNQSVSIVGGGSNWDAIDCRISQRVQHTRMAALGWGTANGVRTAGYSDGGRGVR